MKLSIFVLLSFLCLGCFAQNPPQKVNANYEFKAVRSDSGGLGLPNYSNVPLSPVTNYTPQGSIAYNVSDSSVRVWTGKQWLFALRSIGVWDTVISVGIPLGLDSIFSYNNIDSFLNITWNFKPTVADSMLANFSFSNIPSDAHFVVSQTYFVNNDLHDDTSPVIETTNTLVYSSYLPVTLSGHNNYIGEINWIPSQSIVADTYMLFQRTDLSTSRLYTIHVEYYVTGEWHIHVVRSL